MTLRSFLSSIIIVLSTPSLYAFQLDDAITLELLISAMVQQQNTYAALPSDSFLEDNLLDTYHNNLRGGIPMRIGIGADITSCDMLYAQLGFASGNGLNKVSPWETLPWAPALGDDVRNINGSSRDHLLTAWYKHTIEFTSLGSIAVTAGLIDSSEYLDQNQYANDEYTQFMNDAFVNSVNHSLPFYDFGAVIEWAKGQWSLNAVGMRVGKNPGDRHEINVDKKYDFWGIQLGYKANTSFGTGHYRILLMQTSKDFFNQNDHIFDKKSAIGLSVDQAVGDTIGVFSRVAKADGSTYKSLFSGGIQINGCVWNRANDTIGIAYARLNGERDYILSNNIFEAYYLAHINPYLSLTADIQYMHDKKPLLRQPKKMLKDGFML